VLQQAEVGEVALPVIERAGEGGREEGEGGREEEEEGERETKEERGGGRRGGGRKGEGAGGGKKKSTLHSQDSTATSIESDLRWRGNITTLTTQTGEKISMTRSSGSPSENNSGGEAERQRERERGSADRERSRDSSSFPHYSDTQDVTVIEDLKSASIVDLSAVKREYEGKGGGSGASGRGYIVQREGSLRGQIEEITTELDTLQPNMHAVERLDLNKSSCDFCDIII
jgi:hypothetical protein